MNKWIGLGRLTADPELTVTPSGVSVAKFTIAVNRKFKNATGEYEADFLNCVAWRKTGEFITQYFSKGQMICVDGSVQTRNYTDKEGNKRYITEIVVDGADFCGGKASQGGSSKPNNDPAGFVSDSISDEDLPF